MLDQVFVGGPLLFRIYEKSSATCIIFDDKFFVLMLKTLHLRFHSNKIFAADPSVLAV
jgi:hypothetical protein